MRKPKILLLTLCTSMAFGANADGIFSWFGKYAGDDGKASTVGNPSAKAQVTTFNITNSGVNDINSVSVLDAKGKSVYNDRFVCKSGQKCTLNLTNIAASSKLTFKFMNAKNQLVEAYMTSRISKINSAILDERWLGIYVFGQLVKSSKQDPLVLNSQLVSAFNGAHSPDNLPDIFEELGLYFLAQNGGANEAKFYADVTQKLKSNQPLVAATKNRKLLTSSSNNSGAYVKSTGNPQSFAVKSGVPENSPAVCDKTIRSTFQYIQSLAGFIPVVGDGFAAAFGITGQILNDSCPSPMDSDVAKKFAEIDDRLNQFDATLNDLNFSVAELHKYVDMNQTTNTLNTMNSNESALFNHYFDSYMEFTKDGSNLSTYVQQQGGLKKAFDKSQKLRTFLSTTGAQLSDLENLLSNDQIIEVKKSLDSMCKEPNTSGNIINTRIGCNVATSKVVYTLDLNALKMRAMLLDEINVISNAIKSGNVTQEWLQANVGTTFKINGVSSDWQSAADTVSQNIENKVSFVGNTLVGNEANNKLYRPLDGLSETLQQSIKTAQCVSGSLPAITEWHTIHPNDSTNKTPYIVTKCDDGTGNLVTSKYFYNKRGATGVDDKVVNVMGVIVPDRFFHGGDKNNYGYIDTFPWANSSTLVEHTSNNQIMSDYRLASVFHMGSVGNPQVSVIDIDGGPSSVTGSFIKSNPRTFGSDNSYNKLIAFESVGSNSFLVNYELKANSNDLFTIMRYTKGDYTYAWVMRTWTAIDNSSYWNKFFIIHATPQCLTNDCSVINTNAKLEKIKYIDGTSIEWNKTKDDTVLRYGQAVVYDSNIYNEYTINVK